MEKLWEEEVISEDWLTGVIIVIALSGRRETLHTVATTGVLLIILRATASKLLQMILLRRMDIGMECFLRENLSGIRQNCSCIDKIHSLRNVIHNYIAFHIPLCINFVEFKVAFD